MMDKFNKKLLLQEIRRQEQVDGSVPNYEQMGYEPPVGGKNLIPNELKRERKVNKVSAPAPEEESVKVYARRAPPQPAPPPQSQVIMSGMNDEQSWMSDKVFGRRSQVQDENDTVDLSKVQGLDNMNVEEVGYEFEEIEQLQQQHINGLEQLAESLQTNGVSSMQRGEFAVFYDGELIKKSFDPSIIKLFIENILFNYKVDIDDITVVKSLNISFGLNISDG